MLEKGLWKGSDLDSSNIVNPVQVVKKSEVGVSHAEFGTQVVIEDDDRHEIEFGSYVKHSDSPFLVNEISGDSFRLNPIRTGETVSFIYDPTRPRSRKRNKSYEDEIVIDSTIPQALYTILRTDSTLTPDNIYERIKNDFGRNKLWLSTPSKAYIDWVRELGSEVDGLSNSPFAIGVDYRIMGRRFRAEGEQFQDNFLFAGRFDEVREGEENDQIVRIRTESGRPNTFDAIRLGLDNLAYQAVNGSRDESKEPKTFLFNLVDGKRYEFIVKNNGFYVQLIDSLVYSSFAEKAGYVPQADYSKLEFGMVDMMPDPDHEEKNVFIETQSGSKTKLTAKEAHERARNCLRRMAGQMQKIDRMYDFNQINY